MRFTFAIPEAWYIKCFDEDSFFEVQEDDLMDCIMEYILTASEWKLVPSDYDIDIHPNLLTGLVTVQANAI